jgi:hypothetical protein
MLETFNMTTMPPSVRKVVAGDDLGGVRLTLLAASVIFPSDFRAFRRRKSLCWLGSDYRRDRAQPGLLSELSVQTRYFYVHRIVEYCLIVHGPNW